MLQNGRLGRSEALLLVAALLPGLILPGLAGATGVVGLEATAAVDPATIAQNETNATIRHEDPETVDESGDLEALQGWLAERLADRLTTSSVELSQEQYRFARQTVGEEYRRELAKYVDVARETDDPADDRVAAAFDRAREQQTSFASTVEAIGRPSRRTARRGRGTTTLRRGPMRASWSDSRSKSTPRGTTSSGPTGLSRLRAASISRPPRRT